MKLAPAELRPLMAALRETRGLTSKREIQAAARLLGSSAGAIRNGDDAAALPDPDGGYTLFAAEGMHPGFVQAEPFFAGLCAVLTNVNDIAAMGGRSRAIVDVLWAGEEAEQTRDILEGLAAGARLFGVPIVGGHTGRGAGGACLCAAVLGKARRLISGFAALPGQHVLACIDLAGRFRGDTANFDALDSVEPQIVRERLELLPQLAEAGLVGAGKDISMAGLLGTLLMLLETSGCGAELDLAAVPAPGAALGQARRWLEAFPSYGFLLTAQEQHIPEIVDRFAALDVVAAPIAQLTPTRSLDIAYAGESVRYWDLTRENLMGFGHA